MQTELNVHVLEFRRTGGSLVTSVHWNARYLGDTDVAGANNGRGSVEEMAENLARNFDQFPQSVVLPILFSNGPTDEQRDMASRLAEGKGETRPLTFSELITFFCTFLAIREKIGVA